MSSSTKLPEVVLQKITLNYSSEQDRLQLLALSGDEDSYSFWITRNLLKLLIGYLGDKFSPKASLPGHQRIVNELLLETQVQSAVQQHDKSVSPVSNNDLKESFLITSVDISVSEPKVTLVWKSPETQFLLSLSRAEFFQWLSAMRKALMKADWDIGWPDWIENADPDQKINSKLPGDLH